MDTGGRVAGLTAALLAIGMAATSGGPAVADANGTVVARAALAGRPVPGGNSRMVPMAVTENGKILITVTTAGISKYSVTRHSVKRLGRSAAKPDEGKRLDLEVLPDGRFAYVTDQATSGPEASRMQIFDLRRDRPRLVRTLTFPALGRVHDTEMAPDGRRLFLRAYEKLKVLRLGHPARPRRERSIVEPGGYGPLQVTADGTRMLTALTSAGRGAGNTIRVWDISDAGHPVVEREGTVRLPGDDTASWIEEIAISPRGDAIYVKSGYCNDVCEDSYTDTTRLRFSDLATEAQTGPGFGLRAEFLQTVSNGGGKIFMQWLDVSRSQTLVWADPQLSNRHKVGGIGDVRGMALSPGGKTRGMVFVAGNRSGKLRISAVRF